MKQWTLANEYPATSLPGEGDAHFARLVADHTAGALSIVNAPDAARGYTSRERLGIVGGSNGGLLIGAAITQRPELFRAAVWNIDAPGVTLEASNDFVRPDPDDRIGYALLAMALAQARVIQDAGKLVQACFFAVLGLAWIVPLLPLIRWMEKRN